MQFAIWVFIASTTSSTLATNPCERLCILDGADICTGGSWPKGGGICHAYFLLPSGEHCYHNSATSTVCHDRLPPLTIEEAAFFVAALTPESTSSTSTRSPSTRPTSTTTTTTTTTTSTTTTTTPRSTTTTVTTTTRPISSSTTSTTTSTRSTTTTTSTSPSTRTTTTTTSTTTTSTTTSQPDTIARRRIVHVGTTGTPAATTTTTTSPPVERRRRVFPIHGAGEQLSPHANRPVDRVVPTIPSSTSTVDLVASLTSSSSELVMGEGPNVIGQAVEAAVSRGGQWPIVASLIANRFSRIAISGEEFIFLWERSRGDLLLEHARLEGPDGCRRASRLQNACFALLLFVGEMPLPADVQSRSDALGLIGFTQFATDNADALSDLLRSSISDYSLHSYVVSAGMDARSQGVMTGFAANWIGRFPMLSSPVANSTSAQLLAAVVRHRIFRYMMQNDPPIPGGYGYYAGGGLNFNVHRRQTFAESYETLARSRPADVRRGVLSARFLGEGAVGQGVIREWYSQISQDVYASDYALFERSEDAPHYYRISRMADHHPRDCFIAIGRFMAMSIIQGIPVGIALNTMFYKRLLGHTIGLADVETIDGTVFSSIRTVMGYTTAEEMDAIDAPLPHVYPEGHADVISATLENRDTQLALALDNLSTNGMPDQFAWFAEGFFAVTPREMFDGLSANDLSSLLFGDSNIDIDDLEAHVQFEGFSRDSQPVRFLMQVLREMSQDDRRRFLKFVTSNTQLPLGGFSSLNPTFKITRVHRSGEHLPDSHTCFNTLDLPDYISLEQTRDKIIYAIRSANGQMDNY